MSLTMYQASVPAFLQMLASLSAILDKAEAHAAARKIEPAVLLNTRLTPDMLPLVRQVQLASDFAKGTAARLAGIEPPITIPIGGQPHKFTGQDYLIKFALPNFYFHITTAYAILRHCGVEIGKRDFLGQFGAE